GRERGSVPGPCRAGAALVRRHAKEALSVGTVRPGRGSGGRAVVAHEALEAPRVILVHHGGHGPFEEIGAVLRGDDDGSGGPFAGRGAEWPGGGRGIPRHTGYP